ncbi:RNA polymerase sigma factor [Lacunisphaera limnophila]|uniref:RNA polymerase sigma factor n=1 Tax=Lacunisphaera limnophila TaxID=1838286 RepID=A0A1D8ARQ3_9BACT|nr:sigma-70 family RNA polymerase sigma factor [Lacunisphaera limnophila]AOS43539.1 RNA polymerase sigma factor [Lacunisphaera limnophila]
MPSSPPDPTPAPAGGPGHQPGVFVTTDWSIILDAATDGSRKRLALEKLCRSYWRPVYTFIRRLGHDGESAKDLTQAFFAHLLENDFFATADRERGRFRGYLRQTCRHFLSNDWQKRTAEKRGGGQAAIPWENLTAAEEQQFASPADPSMEFDRQWAITLLRHALEHLEAESVHAGEQRTFELLRPYLTLRPEPGDYARLAASLGVSRGSVPVLVHRLSRRYQELIRAQVAATVADRTEIDDELRYCLKALG